jgi:TPR repeat protein
MGTEHSMNSLKYPLKIVLLLSCWNSALASENFERAMQAAADKDYATAFTIWQDEAENNGDASSQFNLALLYQFGLGVVKDVDRAVFWYAKAAAVGDSKSQTNLGHLLYEGIDVKRDISKAMELFEYAARQGNVSAQYNLSRAYLAGVGVKPDFIKGFVWLSMASKSSIGEEAKKVEKGLLELSEMLTPIQLSIAKLLAVSCWDSGFKACERDD